MPTPVISTYTSIIDPRQNEYVEFQPTASNLVGSGGDTWTASALPAGMSISGTTGLISGSPTHAGVYNISIQVSNTNGTSAPLVFPIGVRPGVASTHSGIDLITDVQTGLVSTGLATPAAAAGEKVPLFSLKSGDNRLLYCRYQRGDLVLDLGILSNLQLVLKQRDTEDVIVLGGGSGEEDPPLLLKTGSATSARYIIAVALTEDALTAALADVENDGGTKFLALAELTWTEPNTTGVGPSSLVRSSQTFYVELVRELKA